MKNIKRFNEINTSALNRGEQSEGMARLNEICDILGYDSFEDFIQDNPGAVEAVDEWCNSIPEFEEKLNAEEDDDDDDDKDPAGGRGLHSHE